MNDPIANPQHRSNITLFVEGILKPISSSVTNDEDVEEEHKMYVAHSVPIAADIRRLACLIRVDPLLRGSNTTAELLQLVYCQYVVYHYRLQVVEYQKY